MVNGLEVAHKALSPEVIQLNRGRINYAINIGSNYIELDSAQTIVQFNRLLFSPYVRAEKNNNKWHFRIGIDKPWFNSNDLFASLPEGLFGNLKGLRTTGQLAYHFLLDLDMANLNAMISVMSWRNPIHDNILESTIAISRFIELFIIYNLLIYATADSAHFSPSIAAETIPPA